jgi:D-erythro-7,8-dihydroneopterin triphosphate epimerase
MTQEHDRIHIRDLAMACIVGTNPEERTNKQQVILNVSLECDLRKASHSDDLGDTVDYRALKRQIVAMVESSTFFLIERLAQAVADLCLADSRVRGVRVVVDKPGALTRARSVAVDLHRTQRRGRR